MQNTCNKMMDGTQKYLKQMWRDIIWPLWNRSTVDWNINEILCNILYSLILTEKQTIPEPVVKRNCIVTTTIVTELTQTHPLQPNDASSTDQVGLYFHFWVNIRNI